jgi:hypothetical protein
MALQITPEQQTIIKKLNLDVGRDDNGNYRIDDPMIAQFYRGVDPAKRGIYTSRKLDNAIYDAVTARKEHDAEMIRRSGFSTAPDPIAAKRRRKAGAPVSAPPPPPPPPIAQVAPKPRVVIDDEVDDEPVGDLELDDVELDDTGKRLKKYREPPRYSKSESSFLRAARVLVKRPNLTQEALAKDAILAMATATAGVR